MKIEPVVSVVIDNYNYAAFLREAIDSALGQTYSRVEVVVVDDGSTDGSRQIIASYGDRIVPVLKDNGGQASAFNAGLLAAGGDVVCFLDADDALAPTAVERAVVHFFDPAVGKVHWPLLETDAGGVLSGAIFPASPLAEGDLLATAIADGPLAYITSPTSGNAWSRSYLNQVSPVAECGNRHGADAYLSILAPVYGRIARVTEPQGKYRIHSRSFSGNQRYRERTPALFSVHCRLLAQHLSRAGFAPDTRAWKRKQFAWQLAMKRAARELQAVVPAESRLVVLDNGAFGSGFLRQRKFVPFLERGGEYFGPPADDEAALAELDRIEQQGGAFVAVAWPAFWWLDHYRQFAACLRSRSRSILENERLIVFELLA
jgi:glycosyltransferase involved in cell wall biosynthesis